MNEKVQETTITRILSNPARSRPWSIRLHSAKARQVLWNALAADPDALRGSFAAYRALDATIAQNERRKNGG